MDFTRYFEKVLLFIQLLYVVIFQSIDHDAVVSADDFLPMFTYVLVSLVLCCRISIRNKFYTRYKLNFLKCY
jgi:hypothetical protein